ncbi:MAG TPA: NAD(P)/FAD-dependent oxidoreductase, partial [Thermohalobaculum sp.]|nr:NAD(P)/FAD-dependent oxidoreductase [Thermohalobaculum sp.]
MGDIDGATGSWGFARGGMGSISRALAAALCEAGGEIRTDAEIERFLVKDGRIEGVALASGEEVRARVVASNMDVKRTFLGCMDPADLPDDFLAGVRRFRIRGSSAKINLALDALPDFPAAPEGAGFLAGDLHASESLLELERAYDDWKDGRWSAEPYFDMLIPSLIDPTMAPPGRHMMTLFIQYAPYALERDGVASGENWDDVARDALRDAVFDKIEGVSPGFRNHVLHAEIRTPRDLEREVGLTEGNIFQGELSLDQLLFNRPVPGWAQYRSPIRGLYLVGSSAHPGGGVMAAPGANAAREILRDAGRLRRGARAFRAA